MVGFPHLKYDGGGSTLALNPHTIMPIHLLRTGSLRRLAHAVVASLALPLAVSAQSQYAGTYFGTVNTKVTAGPISTESALGVYQAVVSSSGAIDVNGQITGTVDASGNITFDPSDILSLTTGTISGGVLSTPYGNLLGNGTSRYRLNASTSFTPAGSAGSGTDSGNNGGTSGEFQNGSFEVGPNPGVSWITMSNGASNVTGWTVTSGTVDYIGTAWQASDGSRSFDMSGLGAGGIAQTFNTTAGQVYTVEFDYAGNPGYGTGTGVKNLRVSVNNSGSTSEEYSFDTTGQTLGNMGWVKKTFTFTASASTTTLTFTSLTEGVYGPAIDNVRVNGSTGATVDTGNSTTTTILGGTAATAPTNLTTYRNKQGQTFEFIVTGATSGAVWGTDIYTDDSNVAAAAVHAGVLEPGETKTVTISILPGQSSYAASTRHGVTTRAWGSWSGSYSFGEGTGSTGTAVSVPALSVSAATVNVVRTYAYGAPFILSVPLTGVGPFTYQWYLNGVAISGATSGTYSLPRLTSANAGSYSVRVSNSAGSSTIAMGSVTVSGTTVGVPQITLQPLNKVVAPGDTFSLATSATGAGLSFQWYRNGVALTNETGPIMLRTNVSASHAGTYTVRVSNSAGSITSDPATVSLSQTASVLRNVSVRASVGAGGIITPGFVIKGTGTKRVVIRAVGPGLSPHGVDGFMSNPKLTLFSNGTQIATNDDWDAALAPVFNQLGAFPITAGSQDAAIMVDLPATPGGSLYSVQVTGVNNSSGVVLVEAYDADTAPTSKLVNVSLLGRTAPGADVLTLGFVVEGSGQRTFLMRGIGPTLSGYGVTDYVSDPSLGVFDGNDRKILENTDWNRASYLSEMVIATNFVGAFELGDQSSDAATLSLIEPGRYSVQVTGAGGTSGTALAEIYEVP